MIATTCCRNCWNAWSAGDAGDRRAGLDSRLAAQVQEASLPSPVIIDYDEDLVATFSGPVIWILGHATPSRMVSSWTG